MSDRVGNVFRDLRRAALGVARDFAGSQSLELDEQSMRLVKLPGQWRGLWLFDAVNVGGDLKELAVMMEPSLDNVYVRLMSPGIVRTVALLSFRGRVSKALDGRPKSQGQFVSDAAYENWKREQGDRVAFSAVMGGSAAPAPQPENWPAGRPFPHQAE